MKNGLMHRCGASAQFVKDNGVGGSKIMLGNDEMLSRKKQLEAVLQTDRSEDLIEAVNRIEQLVAVRI